MTDIVERLRNLDGNAPWNDQLVVIEGAAETIEALRSEDLYDAETIRFLKQESTEAADEITRLRAEVERLAKLRTIELEHSNRWLEECDALRAEVERLKRRVEYFTHAVHTCHDECDRPLCKTTRERDALRATNARLRDINAEDALIVAQQGVKLSEKDAQIADLRATNARLLEALAGLLNGVVNNIPVTKEEFGLIKAARAALAGAAKQEDGNG